MDSADRVDIELVVDVRAPRQARAAVGALAPESAAPLVVSELVTYAVSQNAAVLSLSASRNKNIIEIDVRDGRLSPLGANDIVTRLLNAFALAWGARQDADGQTLWALVAATPSDREHA